MAPGKLEVMAVSHGFKISLLFLFFALFSLFAFILYMYILCFHSFVFSVIMVP